MDRVIGAYRTPRVPDKAIRIAESRERERAALAKKALKDEEDLRAAILYTLTIASTAF